MYSDIIVSFVCNNERKYIAILDGEMEILKEMDPG